MAISYPVSLPAALNERQLSIRARSTVEVSASPFTKEQQVYVFEGEWWEADISLAPMRRAEAEAWLAFLLSLNGREGTFLMGESVNITPRGPGTGTPLVNGALQSGKSLLTDGWSNGISGILKAGDWFQLGSGATSRLHKMTVDASSNGSGQATLDFWPRLRLPYADNAPLTLNAPKTTWRLTSNDMEWSIGLAQLYGINFSAIEAL